LLFIFGLNRQSIAQNEDLRFEHIGLEEGLSNEKVTAMLQDSKGYIWFGTFDGLNKYDGYTFTKYKFDPSDSNSLSQNLIYTIFEDKYGTIWVSTFEGLCKFDWASEKFSRYKPSTKARFSNPNIGAINEDSNGMIWVGSYTGGLCRFNRQTGKFLPEYIDLAAGIKDAIQCIYKDRAGTLWVGNHTGLHNIQVTAAKAGQPSGYSIRSYQYDSLNPYSLSGNLVYSVFEDKAGILWVGTNSGLNSLDRKTGIFKHYQNDPKNIHSIIGNTSFAWGGSGIKEDKQGNLWINTDRGLNKLNKERSVFTTYFRNPNNPYSISTDFITNIEIDKEGVLWVSSEKGKLNKANLENKGFGLRRNDPNNINSLSSNEVTSIVEDSSGIIWIGTHTGGLNRWDRKTNQFIHFRHDPSNAKTLRHDAIQAILLDRQGHLWVCNGDVLSLFNEQTGEFTHYKSDETNYEEHYQLILSITEDREGLLWLGLAGSGIKNFDKKTRKFIKHYYYNKADSTGISDFTAIAIFADTKDNIWIGYGSMATDKYNKRTKQFTHYKHEPQDAASISSNIVNCFYEDSKGNLWLGTWAGGLSYFDYRHEKFTTFTDKQGLVDNTVYSILEDNKNHVWFGTQNGISQFDPVTNHFINYDYKDGLRSNIFAAGIRNRGAHFKGKDGTLYFGGNNGFIFFDPLQIKTNTTIAPVVITQFKLFDHLIKGASESKEIILNYDENYFSFEFASLSFYNPAKNQYKYKLEGVDKDWVYSGSRRYAGYTNIGPGTYTFKVKGTNNDGIWNEKGASISIIVKPPWWQTWWAYVLYVSGFVLMIWMLTAYRSRQLKAENILLEEKVIKRTNELKQSMEEKFELSKKIESQQALLNERLRISRELHDDIGSTLGSISIYSEVAKKRTEKNKNTNEVLSKIGIASREIIDKMSDIVWSLNPVNENFEQLHSRMITFAAMMLTPQNIRYNFLFDERLKELPFTGGQLKNIFLIFKETLHNIVKYAACKKVSITLCVKNNYLIMAIEDDGNGFDADATILNDRLINSSPLGRLGGAGIKNMHARADDMNGELNIHSKINEGTTVQLTLNL